jgi:hypothetical protein
MRSKAILTTLAIAALSFAVVASAATPCPPEVKEAGDLLKTKTTSVKTASQPGKVLAGARGQDPQTARGQDPQTARGQDPQTARGQDKQAARGQDPQTARGQDPQTARGQDPQAPRNVGKGWQTALANARRLVAEAETSCRDGDDRRASANARAAMELLKYLP